MLNFLLADNPPRIYGNMRGLGVDLNIVAEHSLASLIQRAPAEFILPVLS